MELARADLGGGTGVPRTPPKPAADYVNIIMLLTHSLQFCQPNHQPEVTENQPIFQFCPTYES